MPSFQSAFDKIGQAQIHIEVLWNAVRAFEDLHAYELVGQSDADSWRSERLRIRIPPPVELPMIAGDAVHNARSALDHAIYEVSRAPVKKRRRVSFPLYSNRLDYLEAKKSGWWERALAGVPDKYRTVVEREQPFRRGNRRLGALADFDNIDKHRTVHASFARFGRVPEVKVTPGFVLEFRYWPIGKRLHEDAEVFAYRVVSAPPRKQPVEVQINYLVTVGFGPRNLTKEDLADLVNRSALVVLDFLKLRSRTPIAVEAKEVGDMTAIILPGGPARPHLADPLQMRVFGPPS